MGAGTRYHSHRLSPRLRTLFTFALVLSSGCGLVLEVDGRADGSATDVATNDVTAVDARTPDADLDAAPPVMDRVMVYEMNPGMGTCPDGADYTTEIDGCIFYRQGIQTVSVPVTTVAEYTEVWGRARGRQQITPDAFAPYFGTMATLDDVYVDGISITTGTTTRQHVYTLGAGLHVQEGSGNACPCDGGRGAPPFIGEDWTCETGNNMAMYDFDPDFEPDVLWDDDSLGGSACTPLGPGGEFHVTLASPASGPLEIRFMKDTSDDAYAVTELVLWVR